MIKAYVEPIFDNFMFEMLTLLPFGMCLDTLCFSFCSWDDVLFFIIKHMFINQTKLLQLLFLSV